MTPNFNQLLFILTILDYNDCKLVLFAFFCFKKTADILYTQHESNFTKRLYTKYLYKVQVFLFVSILKLIDINQSWLPSDDLNSYLCSLSDCWTVMILNKLGYLINRSQQCCSANRGFCKSCNGLKSIESNFTFRVV